MPLARSALATAVASTSSTKSMVPLTRLRSDGFSTNGVAKALASAQPYRISADRSQRPVVKSSPPLASIHAMEFESRSSDPSAGVLYVCSKREFSSAIGRLSEGGVHHQWR